jgi:benzylsuccinate CoA-transferase BbsF subunit
VVIENFPERVAKKYSMDYESLRRLNPNIIVASCTGFGKTGPDRHYLAYGRNLHASSGLSSLIGYSGDKPLGLSGQWSDTLSPLALTYSILAALFHRARTGQGQFIDVAMVEATASLLGEPIMDYVINNRVWGCMGNRSTTHAPQGCYRCRGEDRWIAVSVCTREQWEALCRVMDRPDWLKSDAYADPLDRFKHQEALDRSINSWTKHYTAEELTAILQKNGIPAGPVIDPSEGLANDPHIKQRNALIDIDHLGERKKTLCLPWRFKNKNFRYLRGPLLGEHNEEVFRGLLRLSEERYGQLIAQRAIY